MTPHLAGEMCDRLDKALRGSETNLSLLSNMIVVVIRDELWKARTIRTGELVRCESFLELLTAEPLRGFGEDPVKVAALLKDDAEALKMYRRAINRPVGSNNITTHPEHTPTRGTGLAYTLDRLSRDAP